MLSRWMKELPILKQMREEDKENNRKRTSWHVGRTGILVKLHLHEELLSFVEEYRLMGFSVSKKILVFQASRLSGPNSLFIKKTYGAKVQAISRWMLQNRLTIRSGTHQAQEEPEVMLSLALDFIINIAHPAVHPSLPTRHRQFILNMDQTPVFFSMHATKTVETVGKKTIHICVAKNGSQ